MLSNNPLILSAEDLPMINKILDCILDGVLVLDKSGHVSYVNPSLCSLIGYKAEELVGLSQEEEVTLLLDLSLVEYEDIRASYLEVLQGRTINNRRKLKHKLGSFLPVQQFIYPIINGKNEIIGALFIYKDLHQELLLEISHAINSTLNINEIIETTINSALEHLGLSTIAVFLYNKQKNVLELAACNAMKKEELKLFDHQLGQGAPGIIAAERRPLYIRDMKTDALIKPEAQQIHNSKSSIGFPLISKGELLGVVAFDAYTVRDFTNHELYLFESIANNLAVTIHNAKLYNYTKKLAITDGLTGLYNYQYFQRYLDHELKITKKNANCLSLLMIDLDYFKLVNDHFGHPEGDNTLKQVAKVLRKNMRNTDIICRCGGEEFAIILSDCSTENAIAFSERTRQAIEQLNIGKKNVFKLTASFGIATYPNHAITKEELIAAADISLYKAKKSRNTISVAKSLKISRV